MSRSGSTVTNSGVTSGNRLVASANSTQATYCLWEFKPRDLTQAVCGNTSPGTLHRLFVGIQAQGPYTGCLWEYKPRDLTQAVCGNTSLGTLHRLFVGIQAQGPYTGCLCEYKPRDLTLCFVYLHINTQRVLPLPKIVTMFDTYSIVGRPSISPFEVLQVKREQHIVKPHTSRLFPSSILWQVVCPQ